MRAISYGNSYEIFDDSLKTYEKLPVQNYIVRFSQTKGFYLEKYSDIEIKESKIYGVHLEKIDKVLIFTVDFYYCNNFYCRRYIVI